MVLKKFLKKKNKKIFPFPFDHYNIFVHKYIFYYNKLVLLAK